MVVLEALNAAVGVVDHAVPLAGAGARWAGEVATLDPGVQPNFSGLPGIDELRKIAGGFVGLGLILCVVAIALGGALMGIGKLAQRSALSTMGGAAVLGGIGGAIVIAAASGLVAFFSNIGAGI